MAGAWWDKLGDYASDLGGDITEAAGDYAKGYINNKLEDKKKAPDSAPVAHVGQNGAGGAIAVTPKATAAAASFWGGLPSWSKATIAASSTVLVLGVVILAVRR